MLPTVFLSLSGTDEKVVADIHEHLPDGMAHFYPRSFSNGESLLAAMEERVGKATVFAFFASKASLESCWVNFELDRARLAKIRNASLRLLVFPVSQDISHRDLPGWMQEYWIAKAGVMSCTRFRRHQVRCFMEREVRHGEKAVYTGVQA